MFFFLISFKQSNMFMFRKIFVNDVLSDRRLTTEFDCVENFRLLDRKEKGVWVVGFSYCVWVLLEARVSGRQRIKLVWWDERWKNKTLGGGGAIVTWLELRHQQQNKKQTTKTKTKRTWKNKQIKQFCKS